MRNVLLLFLLLFFLLPFLLVSCSGGGSKTEPTKGPWFRDVASESGLVFEHNPGAKGQYDLPEIMGSGSAVLDYDGDGDLDIFLMQGSPDGGSHKLFRNELVPAGKMAFTDVTKATGLERSGVGMGAATGDFNNDGRPDLLVTAYGPNTLYRNNGNGTFTDVTAESPEVALKDRWSTSAAFVDYDRDGWLDLVTLNYVEYSPQIHSQCGSGGDYCTPRAYGPRTAHVFHNVQGKFEEMTVKTKLSGGAGPGLGVVPIDVNQDGWMDLFVSNDSSANHLWMNLTDGKFEENALQAGTAYGQDGIAKGGRGIAIGDYDNDGDEDLLVLNLRQEGATFFRNDGTKGFADVSQSSGVFDATLPWTGAGAGLQDFDRDGWLDLFLANGAVSRREDQRGKPYPYEEKNLLLRNPGKPGEKFETIPLDLPAAVSRSTAFGDIDNDGDVDILLNVNHGKARLLLNETAKRNWIAVQLDGAGMGEGAKVVVKAAGLPEQMRTVRTSGSYLAASDARVYFGLGAAEKVESVRVIPLGKAAVERTGVQVNAILRVAIDR
jgi:enediyne biosynthesis protein E4